jgi:hypothetical protein
MVQTLFVRRKKRITTFYMFRSRSLQVCILIYKQASLSIKFLRHFVITFSFTPLIIVDLVLWTVFLIKVQEILKGSHSVGHYHLTLSFLPSHPCCYTFFVLSARSGHVCLSVPLSAWLKSGVAKLRTKHYTLTSHARLCLPYGLFFQVSRIKCKHF